MSVSTQPHPALRWDGRRLAILDQTLLPGAEVWLALEGAADTAHGDEDEELVGAGASSGRTSSAKASRR